MPYIHVCVYDSYVCLSRGACLVMPRPPDEPTVCE